MNRERLQELLEAHQKNIGWVGPCHDCGKSTQVTADAIETGIVIKGGAVYETGHGLFHIKCDDCFNHDMTLRDYQPCEVYSRVVGYLRPVAQWNDAKQAEFKDRKDFEV